MALINRISRLFRADLHAVLDRIEEPDVLLKQAVREMEDELGNDQQRLKLLSNEQTQLQQRQTDLAQTLERLEGELDICFSADKHELARSLVKRKIEATRFSQILDRKQENLATAIKDLKQRIDENQARLYAMQQKLELLSEQESQPVLAESLYTPDISVGDDEVEVAFLREKQRRAAS